MKQDTRDFLATLLWLAENDEDTPLAPASEVEDGNNLRPVIDDFSPAFVDAAEAFVDGFRAHLEATGFDMARLACLERSFGGNVYLSLSGHGAGFFDDRAEDLAELHDVLKNWAGVGRFEELEYSLDWTEEGKIDLAILPQYIDERRARLFKAGK